MRELIRPGVIFPVRMSQSELVVSVVLLECDFHQDRRLWIAFALVAQRVVGVALVVCRDVDDGVHTVEGLDDVVEEKERRVELDG